MKQCANLISFNFFREEIQLKKDPINLLCSLSDENLYYIAHSIESHIRVTSHIEDPCLRIYHTFQAKKLAKALHEAIDGGFERREFWTHEAVEDDLDRATLELFGKIYKTLEKIEQFYILDCLDDDDLPRIHYNAKHPTFIEDFREICSPEEEPDLYAFLENY